MFAGRLIFFIYHLIRLVYLLELLLDIKPRLLSGCAALHLVKLYSQGLLVLGVVAAGRGKHLIIDRPLR